MMWITLAAFAVALLVCGVLLAREFRIAPYVCERCQVPTELAEMQAHCAACPDRGEKMGIAGEAMDRGEVVYYDSDVSPPKYKLADGEKIA